ncbi:MAG TPA: heparan-alpha-glucosaminide N-acetyltransferase domain-containing protein [Sphingomonadaceae bacterium]|nr:heparan-alpha-glucosaminide N-acetyltransferase domain-containing protein [Sphingomonadaceae bacterium]
MQQGQSQSATRDGAPRVDVVDLLRGLVIVLMILDHTRDYFHEAALAFDPTELGKTTPALFLTRWITHLCAPTFVFLAGVSVWLQRAAGRSLPDVRRLLITRGLWLITLELTVVSFGFNFAWPFFFIQVIWAIGSGMLLLALLVHLGRQTILVIGAVLVVGHQLVAPFDAAAFGPAAAIWRLFLEPGALGGIPGFAVYPIIPWFGIMCLGYGLGELFRLPASARDKRLVSLGASALVAFAIFRALGLWGDPSPWVSGPDGVRTALSFINASKYPPSLLFVLLTLGVVALLAPAIGRLGSPLRGLFLAMGRTPFFTYLLHIYVVHGAATAVGAMLGVPPSAFINFLGDPNRLVAFGWGLGLGWVYLIWILIIVALYPASRWFADVKRRNRSPWLAYL